MECLCLGCLTSFSCSLSPSLHKILWLVSRRLMTKPPETQLAPVHWLSSAQEGRGTGRGWEDWPHAPAPPHLAGFTVRVAHSHLGCQLKFPQRHFPLPVFCNLCAPGLRRKPSHTGAALREDCPWILDPFECFSFSTLLSPYFHDSRLFRVRVPGGGFCPVITLCLKPFLGHHLGVGSLPGQPPVFLDSWGGFTQNPPVLQSPAWGRPVVIVESQQVAL